MFDAYFCPRVAARLRAGPQAARLESFLNYLHLRGHARRVCQRYIHDAEKFIRWMARRSQPLASVSFDTARVFACRGRSHPHADVHAALRHFLRHLREQGVLDERQPEAPSAIDSIIAAYDTHLRDCAGLAPATRHYRRRYASEFLAGLFGQDPIQWERLQPGHIHAFVARYGSAGCTAAARVAAVSLRNFLRWLQLQGRIAPSLVAVVPTFRRWRHTALPHPLTNDQYEGVLATFDRSGSVGLRDYCIVTCMGDLGLRCAEVADLMLGDWDESACTLRIAAGKTRRGRVLPVPTRIRKAIIAYIRGSRPSSDDLHLFLRHRTPVGVGISRNLIRGVIGRAFAKIPGFEGRRSTHLLRHTAATRLHQAGADLKRVADILGHMSVDTTAIYAKVDRARLSAVALPWPSTGEVCS